jgi:exopolysaccharide production protein ExoZ
MASAISNPLVGSVHTGLPLPSRLGHIESLQVLRAVAVALVALAHAGLVIPAPPTAMQFDLGIFGIDIFFVISGFILALIVIRSRYHRGPDAAWKFLKRRMIRIYPIYWFFVALTCLRVLHGHQRIGSQYLSSILLLPSPGYPSTWLIIPIAWTLIFEMFFYYLLSAIQVATIKRAVPVLISILCAAVGIGRFYSIRRPYFIVVLNPILLEFAFGACLALAFQKFGRQVVLGRVLVAAGIAGAIIVRLYFDTGAISAQMILTDTRVLHRVFTWGLAALALVAGGVLWSPASESAAWRGAVSIGDSSYSAYLASPLVLEFGSRAILAVFGRYLPGSIIATKICWLVIVAMVLAAGWICYQLVEWPMLRRLQKLLDSKK